MCLNSRIFFLYTRSLLKYWFLSCFITQPVVMQGQVYNLWYDKPASKWTEALPLGNGRLGAMVFGKYTTERIQLNEESVWAGTRINDLNPQSLPHLKEIQELLLNNKNQQAYELTKKYMLGTPPQIRSYQTLGDIYLEWKDSSSVSAYSRQLDIGKAQHTTTFQRGNATITESVFISAPDDILVIHLTSSVPGAISFKLKLNRGIDASTTANGNQLLLTGQIHDVKDANLKGPLGKHLRFAGLADVEAKDGSVTAMANDLVISNASEVLIRFTAKTDYNLKILNHDSKINPIDSCRLIMNAAKQKDFQTLSLRHHAEYQPLFDKAYLSLGKPSNLPTDKRLEQVKNGQQDDALMALFFQYGRYLLLSSSRNPGKLPANLQGIWNDHYDAPWESDYHTNINLQMNYWPADVANVSTAFNPLENFMLAMLEPGKVCAKSMYGAEGWAMHHVTDIYGRTSINADPMWGTSPLAGAWMALNLFDHYDFNRDTSYLRKIYPILKGSCDFILNFLIKDKQGRYVTAPSMSPENSFYLNDTGKIESIITYAPTIDIQIIQEIFSSIRKINNEMRVPRDYIQKLNAVESKLPWIEINKFGGIQEWINDYREVEPGHRHMSQLFGLYPGTSLTRDRELIKAARATIERRLANGGGHTGWSRAWMINFFARLKDGMSAYHHLEQLLRKSTLPNLFDDHPPFQIDGNFGGTAGIAEMLLQSHNDVIEILPAVPNFWSGEVRGLKARGGFEVDIRFEKGNLIETTIHSHKGVPILVFYRGKQKMMDKVSGFSITLTPEQFN